MSNSKPKYTKREAIKYVRSCREDDGPDDVEEAKELFRAIYGRWPDPADHEESNYLGIWSLVCAGA